MLLVLFLLLAQNTAQGEQPPKKNEKNWAQGTIPPSSAQGTFPPNSAGAMPNTAQGVLPDLDQVYGQITGATGPDTQVTLAFTRHDNGIVVGATINGKGPFYFVVDTGATATVISDKTAKQAGLMPTGKKAHVVGVAGKRMHAWVGRAREISVSGAKAKQMEMMVRDISMLNKQGLAGLLGQDFLGRFTVKIDNPNQEITLALPDKAKPMVMSRGEKLMRDILNRHDRLAQEIADLDKSLAQWLRRYQDEDSAQRATHSDSLKKWVTWLKQQRRTMRKVHATLHTAPTVRLSGEHKNNLQRFLYCYPAYQGYADAVQVLANTLNDAWAQDAAPTVGEAAEKVAGKRKALAGCAGTL